MHLEALYAIATAIARKTCTTSDDHAPAYAAMQVATQFGWPVLWDEPEVRRLAKVLAPHLDRPDLAIFAQPNRPAAMPAALAAVKWMDAREAEALREDAA